MYAQPLVVTADARLPFRSSARKFTVPRSSRTVFRTTGSSFARRRTLVGVSPASRSFRTQSSLVDAVRLRAGSARISRAKRAAPSPTMKTCGVRSITARAMLMGCRYPFSAPTAPTRCVVPSTIDASSSTSPRTLGFPPRPTLVSVGSASMIFAHASTASSADPPRARMRIPAGNADAPFPLATIVGGVRAISGRSCPGRHGTRHR